MPRREGDIGELIAIINEGLASFIGNWRETKIQMEQEDVRQAWSVASKLKEEIESLNESLDQLVEALKAATPEEDGEGGMG